MKKIYLIAALFLSIYNLNAQINADTSLIAFFPFNGNANDESGNLNHGTAYEALLTADRFDKDSSAFEFNGYSSYITIPDSPGLQSPANELTQVAWIYIYGWSQVGAAFGPILMKSNSGDNAFQYRLSVSESGVNTAVNNWENAVTIFDTLKFNTWYMVASTLKNDTVKAYINGLRIGEGNLTGPINPDSKPLEIGRDVPGASEFFNGKIDDIRIYNRALSDAEIYVLFEGSLGFSPEEQFTNHKELNLYQNYPNPFKLNTVITWKTSVGCWQTLKIYDIFGKEISTPVNEYKPAGKHETEFNGALLPNGIYFYKLKAGKFIGTKKMIVLK
jgi:hypothetical protein